MPARQDIFGEYVHWLNERERLANEAAKIQETWNRDVKRGEAGLTAKRVNRISAK